MDRIVNLSFIVALAFVAIAYPELALAADPPGTKTVAQRVLDFLTRGEVALLAGSIVLAVNGYRVWRGRAEWEDAVKFAIGAVLIYGAVAVTAWLLAGVRG